MEELLQGLKCVIWPLMALGLSLFIGRLWALQSVGREEKRRAEVVILGNTAEVSLSAAAQRSFQDT